MWKYRIGTVVKDRYGEWGHIVGFARSVSGETNLRVKTSNTEAIREIHPANLTFEWSENE
jgi:hypothetical protein